MALPFGEKNERNHEALLRNEAGLKSELGNTAPSSTYSTWKCKQVKMCRGGLFFGGVATLWNRFVARWIVMLATRVAGGEAAAGATTSSAEPSGHGVVGAGQRVGGGRHRGGRSGGAACRRARRLLLDNRSCIKCRLRPRGLQFAAGEPTVSSFEVSCLTLECPTIFTPPRMPIGSHFDSLCL